MATPETEPQAEQLIVQQPLFVGYVVVSNLRPTPEDLNYTELEACLQTTINRPALNLEDATVFTSKDKASRLFMSLEVQLRAPDRLEAADMLGKAAAINWLGSGMSDLEVVAAQLALQSDLYKHELMLIEAGASEDTEPVDITDGRYALKGSMIGRVRRNYEAQLDIEWGSLDTHLPAASVQEMAPAQ